jgi:hypothetical protein
MPPSNLSLNGFIVFAIVYTYIEELQRVQPSLKLARKFATSVLSKSGRMPSHASRKAGQSSPVVFYVGVALNSLDKDNGVCRSCLPPESFQMVVARTMATSLRFNKRDLGSGIMYRSTAGTIPPADHENLV